MQALRDANISQYEQIQCNRCRLYLRAFTIADITTGDGTRITTSAWAMHPQNCRDLGWPLWGKPGIQDIMTWRRIIRKVFSPTQHLRLDTPLGPWTKPEDGKWEWFESTNAEKLYQRHHNEWFEYKKIGISRRQPRYDSLTFKRISKPDDRKRTTVTKVHKYWVSSGVAPEDIEFSAHKDYSKHEDWLYRRQFQTKNIQKVLHDLRVGTAVAVSDGSFFRDTKTGAAAWIIESQDRSQYLRGQCIVPGTLDMQSPYRSELVGLLAILDKIAQLEKVIEIGPETGCIIACDGLAALHSIRDYKSLDSNVQAKHGDIISAIQGITLGLKSSLVTKHVKGHSEDSKKWEELSRLEIMNISMDHYAKEMAKDIRLENYYMTEYQNHPKGRKVITCQDITVGGTITTKLYNMVAGKRLMEYWLKRNRFKKTDITKIDWEAQEVACQKEYTGIRRFIAKWATGMLAVGKQMERWKMRHTGNCPFCNEEDEDTNHILSCQSPMAIELWEETQWAWIVEMYKRDSNPCMIMPIVRELDTLKYPQRNWPDISGIPPLIKAAIEAQRKIGWKNFLEGLIAIEWSQCQDEYYNEKKSLKTGDTWAQKTIRGNWKFLFQLWQGQNTYLHETDRVNELSGKEELIQAVGKEMDIGLHRLPAADYSYMFRMKKDKLLVKSMEYLKDWLYIIRTARKLHKDKAYIHDKFSSDTALKRWLELDEWT